MSPSAVRTAFERGFRDDRGAELLGEFFDHGQHQQAERVLAPQHRDLGALQRDEVADHLRHFVAVAGHRGEEVRVQFGAQRRRAGVHTDQRNLLRGQDREHGSNGGRACEAVERNDLVFVDQAVHVFDRLLRIVGVVEHLDPDWAAVHAAAFVDLRQRRLLALDDRRERGRERATQVRALADQDVAAFSGGTRAGSQHCSRRGGPENTERRNDLAAAEIRIRLIQMVCLVDVSFEGAVHLVAILTLRNAELKTLFKQWWNDVTATYPNGYQVPHSDLGLRK